MQNHVFKNLFGNLLLSAGALVFLQVAITEPNINPLAGSLVRSLCNLAVAVAFSRLLRDPAKSRNLLGKNYLFLFLWGCFGSLTLLSYYAVLQRLGASSAGFLSNTSGFFLVFIGAWINNRRVQTNDIIASIICLIGAGLLTLEGGQLYLGVGFIFGLTSGLSAAIAYSLVGSRILNESTISLMFYWSLVNILVHDFILLSQSIVWPQYNNSWLLLIVSGTLASLGQYWLTASYQTNENSKIGVISFVGCLISMFLEVFWFGKQYSFSQFLGAMLIFCVGLGTVLKFSTNPKLLK